MVDIKGIIFDCDGVMFESRQANLAYYNDVLRFFGVSPVTETDREKADLCHTAASPEVFTSLLGADRCGEALEYAATLDYRKFIPFMIPEPDLHDVLAELSVSYPLAVATNRGTSMPEILRHFDLGQYFATVVTSRDVERPKPHPDMICLASDRLGIAAEHLLFVGDSRYDRDAAEGAGVQFAAFKSMLDTAIRFETHSELRDYVLEGVVSGGA